MSRQVADACDAQMWTYREHLRGLNRRLAEEYASQNGRHMVVAIEALAEAAPVTLAIAQFHEKIRHSPAKNFWPVIRRTKGLLFLRSSAAGDGRAGPWQRTNSGDLRYKLPGHLLFSPWPPNVRRSVRNQTVKLQLMMHGIQEVPETGSYQALAGLIQFETRKTIWLIDRIKELQGFAMPDSIAALDRWSDEQRSGSNIELRISQGALVYRDGPDRCEIEIPIALTRPLRVPSTPDGALFRHLVRAGSQSYYP